VRRSVAVVAVVVVGNHRDDDHQSCEVQNRTTGVCSHLLESEMPKLW
jgi:hypothetical protein